MFPALKDPDSVLDYSIDWAAWLGDDTIATSTWVISGSDASLVEDSSSNTDTASTIWLSGGNLKSVYTVTNRIVTDEGRTADRSITFTMISK